MVLCGLAAGGCKETVEGQYLDTEGIALVADITAKTTKEAEVEISFLSGGDESNTYVDLDGDTVTVTGDGKKKTLSPKASGEYGATFAISKADAQFAIALDRKDADKKDAKSTSGSLPKDFAVSIEGSGDHSRQDALTIKWDNSGDAQSVRVDIDGDCLFFTFEEGEADDGEFTVPAKGLLLDENKDDKGSCEAKVTVTRTRKGSVDSVFDSESKLRLHQVRSVTFTSVK